VVIACRELELALERLGDARGDALRDDVHLIREQADRCRSILDRMSLEAGASAGEAAMPLPLAALVAEAVDGLDAASRCTVDISPELLVRAFPRASVQGLRNVLDNALKAAPAGTRVSLSATATPIRGRGFPSATVTASVSRSTLRGRRGRGRASVSSWPARWRKRSGAGWRSPAPPPVARA
jgi:signal transduction histidine kinase